MGALLGSRAQTTAGEDGLAVGHGGDSDFVGGGSGD